MSSADTSRMRVVSFGAAAMRVHRDTHAYDLVSKFRADCWDGSEEGFDEGTLKWWNRSEESRAALLACRSGRTPSEAFLEFDVWYTNVFKEAKGLGMDVVFCTDASTFDFSILTHLSSLCRPDTKPYPSHGPDVGSYANAIAMSHLPNFNQHKDSTHESFLEAMARRFGNYGVVVQPSWVLGNVHRADKDAGAHARSRRCYLQRE